MRVKSFGKALFTGLVSLVSGCSLIEKPDELRVGIMARHANADSHVFHEKIDVFTYQIDTVKRINDEFDFSLNLGFAQNETELEYGIDGSTKAKMYSLGGQVSYYPFYGGKFNFDKNRNFSLDFGAEMIMADLDLRAKILGMRYKFSDDIMVWGINVGGTYRFPLDDKKGFYISSGYLINDNESDLGNYDGDGPYARVGMFFRV